MEARGQEWGRKVSYTPIPDDAALQALIALHDAMAGAGASDEEIAAAVEEYLRRRLH